MRCAVLTVSDTRTPDSDTSGALIRETLGFSYFILPDDEMDACAPVVARMAGK